MLVQHSGSPHNAIVLRSLGSDGKYIHGKKFSQIEWWRTGGPRGLVMVDFCIIPSLFYVNLGYSSINYTYSYQVKVFPHDPPLMEDTCHFLNQRVLCRMYAISVPIIHFKNDFNSQFHIKTYLYKN